MGSGANENILRGSPSGPVSPSDPRLARVAVLRVGSDFLGNVTVLSNSVAVTTSDIAALAIARVSQIKEEESLSGAPLVLAFPQSPGSLSVYSVPVEVRAVDSLSRFAVLSFSGTLPIPLAPGLVETSGIPETGSICHVLSYEDGQGSAFLSRGIVNLGSALFSFRLGLDFDVTLPTPTVGAPVFQDAVVVGIVESVRRDALSSAVGVISLIDMAQSKVTDAVRNLVPQFPFDPKSPGPFPKELYQVVAGNKAADPVPEYPADATATAGEPVSATVVLTDGEDSGAKRVELSDADLFARLSVSSRNAVAKADGMRRSAGQGAVHMEYLIAALFDKADGPTRRLFEVAKIAPHRLAQIIRETVGTVVPEDYKAPGLARLPALSRHVRRAFVEAAQVAKTGPIRSRHLLYGVLSVEDCRMVQAIAQFGVKKEDVVLYDAPPLREPVPPLQDILGFDPFKSLGNADAKSMPANPTPKVASDLWCREDRLGYEAYARTIAELITHEETVAPLTIGIKAPWGAGKTSLMKRVQELLDGGATVNEAGRAKILENLHPQLTLREMLGRLKDSTKPMGLRLKKGKDYNFPARITVWFNAWKYQTSEQVWAGMAHCIINQVTARMSIRDRELFWLRLHARRVNADQVRKKVYESVARQLLPLAVVLLVACSVVVWAIAAFPVVPTHEWISKWLQGLTVLSGLFGLVWKFWDKLGDKAADTVKEMVREPGYEGKMGYLHLVESDMRDVLELVTEAQLPPEEAQRPRIATEMTTGAKAPDHSAADAALKRRSSTLAAESISSTPAPTAGSFTRAVDPQSSTKAPLVVFVDDLDRCAPNKVADVVEAINLFLCGDYPNCIFVLGMEPGMVAAALEVANKDVIQKAEEMGLTDQSVPVGWRFMEKIIQLPIMIPPPTPGGRDSYVESLTGMREFNAHMAGMMANVPQQEFRSQIGLTMPSGGLSDFEKVRMAALEPLKEEDVEQFKIELTGLSLSEVVEKSNKVLADAPLEKRRAAAEASKRAYAQAFVERDPLMAKFVKEVAQLVDGNPRQIKRYVNVFRFYSTLRHSLQVDGVASEKELPSDEMMAKFVALSVHWPHAMDCLRKKDAKASESNGRKVTLLESLELESRKTPEEVAAVDASWEKFVGKEGLGLGAWAMRPAFREFLARGESLFQNEGHGLW